MAGDLEAIGPIWRAFLEEGVVWRASYFVGAGARFGVYLEAGGACLEMTVSFGGLVFVFFRGGAGNKQIQTSASSALCL